MATDKISRCLLVLATFNFACVFCATTSTLGEDNANSSMEKWRPKDGRYASPGKDFLSECMESGYFYIDLAKRSIGGNEWSCEVKRLTDTARDSIKLDMNCYDLNLAESLNRPDKNPGDRTFKEVMILKRIGNQSAPFEKL